MYGSGKVITGLVIFLGLLAFPFWYNVGKPAARPAVGLDTPTIRQLAEKECVADTQYMRTSHMELLNEWRNRVVRGGEKIYVTDRGKQYEMSLQNTCLKCHSNQKQFCDRCHDSLGVKPDCWGCHTWPKEETK